MTTATTAVSTSTNRNCSARPSCARPPPTTGSIRVWGVHGYEPRSASKRVGIIARKEHDLASFHLNRVLGVEPKQKPASDHVV
jgi:hypothetical protein